MMSASRSKETSHFRLLLMSKIICR